MTTHAGDGRPCPLPDVTIFNDVRRAAPRWRCFTCCRVYALIRAKDTEGQPLIGWNLVATPGDLATADASVAGATR